MTDTILRISAAGGRTTPSSDGGLDWPNFGDVFGTLQDAILWEAEPDTLSFTFVSESARTVLGYSPAQWLASRSFWEEHLHEDDREVVLKKYRAAATQRDEQTVYRMIAADGRTVWLRDSPHLVKDLSGVGRLRGTMIDITEHKRTERLLFVQYALTKILAESGNLDEAAPNILEVVCSGLGWDLGQLWMIDPDCEQLSARQFYAPKAATVASFHESSSQSVFTSGVGLPGRVWATGETHWISDLPADGNFLRRRAAIEAGLSSAFAFPIRCGDGIAGVMEFFSIERRDADEDLLKTFDSLGSRIGQFIDRTRAETELRDSERRYRELLEGLGVAVYTTDTAGRITFFNEAAMTLWGREPELGKDEWCGSWRLYWPDGSPMQHNQCPMATTLKGNRPVRGLEAIAERPDGTRVSFVPYPTPLRDASGALIGALNVLVDITERKEAEDRLRASENRINLAMEAGGMGAWEWNVATGQVHWSEGLEHIHGIVPGTFAGTFEAFLSDMHPSDRERVIEQTQASLKTGAHDVEYRIIRPDGELRWVVGKGQCMYDSSGQPTALLGVCMDITERKRAADRERFLADAATTLASSLDYDTVLAELANLIVGDMADWCAIDMVEDDESIRRLVLAHADPDKADIARQLEHYVPNSERAHEALEFLRRGEPMLFPELTADEVAAASLDESHADVVRDLGVRSAMIVPLLARGKLLGAITFVWAESGRRYEPTDLALAKDLASRAALAVENARLYRDSQRVQEELRAANEIKDEFLGLVSHELRTPITTIFGGSRLLRSRSETIDEESKQAILRDISSEAERLRRIVENMLVLARAELTQSGAAEPVLLQRIVEGSIRTFAGRSYNRQIEYRVEGTLPPVAAEATYVDQVLRNLFSNADKYSPPDSPIEVRVEAGDDEVIVRVLDEGPGIQPHEAESIFDRFYRSPESQTKAKGVGLGLTVCKRLIEAQAGRIWAQPRDTGGLEVGFALPIHDEVPNED